MRIAQVAPLHVRVPPDLYGGTERVVSHLTEELVRQGHEVTLFASGDSKTAARLVAGCPRALWQDPDCQDSLAHHVRLVERVFAQASQFDVVHFHCDHVHFPLARRMPCPTVTTLHNRLHRPDAGPLFEEYSDLAMVSISDDQRRPVPWANWQATVYHGLPRDLHTYRERPGKYLAFLGRLSPDKGLDHAIDIARQSGMPLKVAARIHAEERSYFDQTIQPLFLANPWIEFVGEVGGQAKDDFLGNAYALLFPIEWAEPFGLVMIEALACGTPVIAFRRGAVPEVMLDTITGFVVDDVAEAVEAVPRIAHLNRLDCRHVFEERYDASRMARDYVEVYRRLVWEGRPPVVVRGEAPPVRASGVLGPVGPLARKAQPEEV